MSEEERDEALYQSVKTALENRCCVAFETGPTVMVAYTGPDYAISVGGKTCIREKSPSAAARKFCHLRSALMGCE